MVGSLSVRVCTGHNSWVARWLIRSSSTRHVNYTRRMDRLRLHHPRRLFGTRCQPLRHYLTHRYPARQVSGLIIRSLIGHPRWQSTIASHRLWTHPRRTQRITLRNLSHVLVFLLTSFINWVQKIRLIQRVAVLQSASMLKVRDGLEFIPQLANDPVLLDDLVLHRLPLGKLICKLLLQVADLSLLLDDLFLRSLLLGESIKGLLPAIPELLLFLSQLLLCLLSLTKLLR
mmetsp:Transcript_61888/g.109981  ORF Transcript_61888/g.109981 Transcript_61888/m.109981 type:complete len:230 (-) Transcript_61888:1057-1746(-)